MMQARQTEFELKPMLPPEHLKPRGFFASRKLGLGVACLAILVDALTKMLALANIFNPPVSVPVIRGLFHFTPAWNRGVSFSMFNGAEGSLVLMGMTFPSDVWLPALLTLVALAASLLFIWLLGKETHWRGQVGMGMVIGGALGNMIDRMQHGAVVDFLHVFCANWHFPIFNVADSALTVGVLLLIWNGLRQNAVQPESVGKEQVE